MMKTPENTPIDFDAILAKAGVKPSRKWKRYLAYWDGSDWVLAHERRKTK